MKFSNTKLKKNVDAWLARDPDPQTRDELQTLRAARDEVELADRFNGRLQFGTAGLRGVIGAGPMRMNSLLVRETAAGLANYVQQNVPDAIQRGLIIAYDGRLDSKRFAQDTASIFCALGFKVYLTDKPTPTPIGAFAVKHLNCAVGVVVTASHNPPEYNGFKVYWENGTQIIPPHDAGIAKAIEAAAQQELPWLDYQLAIDNKKIELLGEEFFASYRAAVISSDLVLDSSQLPTIKIAYTAMHGVGANHAEALLKSLGHCEVFSVASQREPDGTFPTVNFPNPEEAGAMDAVIELAQQQDALLACANDPDADRFAVAVRNRAGEYKMLSGDQIGILLGAYLLAKPRKITPIVCTTIVSSSLLGKIATAAGARFQETLTGFKWLCNVAQQQESDQQQFLFAYEEAIGYAAGRTVWDKDGLSALVLFVQMVSQLGTKNKTVFDELKRLYTEFGLHVNLQKSIALAPTAPAIGDLLRQSPPTEIAGKAILQIDDLKHSVRTFTDGRSESIALAASDVLIYRTEGDLRVIVRPSGTEPKLKCYYELIRTPTDGVQFSEFETDLINEIKQIARRFQAKLELLMTAT